MGRNANVLSFSSVVIYRYPRLFASCVLACVGLSVWAGQCVGWPLKVLKEVFAVHQLMSISCSMLAGYISSCSVTKWQNRAGRSSHDTERHCVELYGFLLMYSENVKQHCSTLFPIFTPTPRSGVAPSPSGRSYMG